MSQEIKKTKLVAVYARVSTSKQEEDGTIATQLSAVEGFAKEEGYTIVKKYLDEGWSGDILARPALDDMRNDAKEKIWEGVLTYDPDRIARRYSYQELVMDELREAGIEVIFVTTPAPKTGEDKILHGVKGLFAEYERVKIAERFRLGKLRKAKEGHIIGTEAPYGLTYIHRDDKKMGYYKINEIEIENLRLIFKLIVEEKLTIRKLIKRLQELGIKPRESLRGVWSNSTLSKLLRNRTYIGEAHFGASYAVIPENPYKDEKYKKIRKTSRRNKPESEWIKIPVPEVAVIDKDLFEQAQKQLRINASLSQRNKKNEYLLAGKIRCICGRTRAGEGPQKGKHLYYRCTDRVHTYPLPPNCKEAGANARIVDELVWNKLRDLMSSPSLLKKQINLWVESRVKNLEEPGFDEGVLRKQLNDLKNEDDRYTRAYGAGVITMEKLREYTEDIRSKIKHIENKLSEAEVRRKSNKDIGLPTSEDEINEFANQAKITLKDLNFQAKRDIVMSVVEKVVGNNQEMKITGFIPVELSYINEESINRNSGPP